MIAGMGYRNFVEVPKEAVKEAIQVTVPCAICGSTDHSVQHIFPEEHFDRHFFDTHSWDANLGLELRLVKCSDCELIYQSPRFNEKFLDWLYPEEVIPDMLTARHFTADNKYAYIAGEVKKYVSKKASGVIVDIGTRYGALPRLLEKNGFRSFGIEMNSKCVSVAKKAGVTQIEEGMVEDIPMLMMMRGEDRIKAVVMTDLIEHLLTPLEDLKILAEYQLPGDKLFIKTMDVDSLGYRLFRGDWYYIHGQHTFYFNQSTLAKLLDKAGYRIVKVDKIAWYKSLRILPAEILNLAKHYWKRRWGVGQKEFFAKNRPKLYDVMNVVAEKK